MEAMTLRETCAVLRGVGWFAATPDGPTDLWNLVDKTIGELTYDHVRTFPLRCAYTRDARGSFLLWYEWKDRLRFRVEGVDGNFHPDPERFLRRPRPHLGSGHGWDHGGRGGGVMTSARPQLPAECSDALQTLHAAGADAHLGYLLRRLHELGWAAATLGRPIGLSNEEVTRRVTQARNGPSPGGPVETLRLPVPTLPGPGQASAGAARRRERTALRVLPPATLARLRYMSGIARGVRGTTPADHPDRQVSLQFTAELARLRDDGYMMTAVAEQLGITAEAIRQRLQRHGHTSRRDTLRHGSTIDVDVDSGGSR